MTARQRSHDLPPVLVWLVAISTVVELLLQGSDWGFWGTEQWRTLAYENGGFWIGLLHDWRPNYQLQPYLMFVTYGFLHGGLGHLLVNMITLLVLGRIVVYRIGSLRFLILYGLSAIGGGLGYAALSYSLQPMVGASGALFGLAGALVAWEYVDRFTARERLWPVVRAVVWLVVLNLILWWAMSGRLAWQTHLGGFVVGWIVALILDPRSRPFRGFRPR